MSQMEDVLDEPEDVKEHPITDEMKEMEMEEEPEHPIYQEGLEIEESNPDGAIPLFKQFVAVDDPKGKLLKQKEQAIYKIANILAKQQNTEGLKGLLVELRPFFNTIAKAKTAKIVRTVVETAGKHKMSADVQVELCLDAIEWCNAEGRTFLRQRLRTRLAALYFQQHKFKESLDLIKKLVREVKKFDDKLLMVEIELLESRVHYALQNLPKAKGCLTAARSAANSVYCPPLLQAEIDLQAGTLCAEEKDYKTAFSYFYEAFEGYNTVNDAELAALCLKYMLLGKIMMNTPEEVYAIINGKAGIKYAGIELEAMRQVADAYKKRSIEAFDVVDQKYFKQLGGDVSIGGHLRELKNNLLEANLIRIIEPFSRVQIAHVAKIINLPLKQVEAKLSEMILDKKLLGILDQGAGLLIVFEETNEDKTYNGALDCMKQLQSAVDRLHVKGKKLAA